MTDEELKQEYLRTKGVTKCPPMRAWGYWGQGGLVDDLEEQILSDKFCLWQDVGTSFDSMKSIKRGDK